MKQRTVKRAVEALNWLHNNPHHIAGKDFHPTKRDENGRKVVTHFYYQNYHERMRVPVALAAEVAKYIRPNTRKFDTRMFALTAAGKREICV